MLVITRRKGETVKIGDDIEVVVVEVGDGSVRLGINAPKPTVILRGELYRAVERENRSAATAAGKIPVIKKMKQEENKPGMRHK